MDGDLTTSQMDEIESLLEEAIGLFGMIDEIKAKTRLVQTTIRVWKEKPWTLSGVEVRAMAVQKIRQFHSDLRNYERRLEEISQTLKDRYGPDFVF